MLFSLIN